MNRLRTLAVLSALLGLTGLLGPALPRPALAAGAAAKDAGAGSIPGIDTSKMTPSERSNLQKLVEKLPSACGKPHSLLVSVKTDPRCKRSQLAVAALHKWFLDGFLMSEVEERYAARYSDDRKQAKIFDIDVSGAPTARGDSKAPVTLVEFSDFECPHCKMAEPVLKKLLEEQPKVKLIFMNFPLGMHPNAGPAAAAAVAAGKQGKFWAMHDKLFDNQGRLGPADLLRIAGELKLDVTRFQADMEGAKVRVAKERAVGDKLDITGTPAFYINGRKFTDRPDYENLRAWVDDELAR